MLFRAIALALSLPCGVELGLVRETSIAANPPALVTSKQLTIIGIVLGPFIIAAIVSGLLLVAHYKRAFRSPSVLENSNAEFGGPDDMTADCASVEPAPAYAIAVQGRMEQQSSTPPPTPPPVYIS